MVAGALLSNGLVLRRWRRGVLQRVVRDVARAVGGRGVGAVNGSLVARFGVAPFIATLGMLYVARGAALLLSGGATYPESRRRRRSATPGFRWLGGGQTLGLPVRSGHGRAGRGGGLLAG